MIVPHLHEVLLPGVYVREIVYHLAGLDPQPLRVRVILIVLAMEDGVRGDGQAGCAGRKGDVRSD